MLKHLSVISQDRAYSLLIAILAVSESIRT